MSMEMEWFDLEIRICDTAQQLGESAAKHVAGVLRECIAANGGARIVLSTGASQFETLDALRGEDIDWQKVEMFHLDEYVGLPETHNASFRKYLKERFLAHVDMGKVHFVDGTLEGMRQLSEEVRRMPVDIALIGIGENAHIAFNDPPADFDTREAFIVVDLDESCKRQQVGEGWFASVEDVPRQAVSMTVHQILQCRRIVSCVPRGVKAAAMRALLAAPGPDRNVPASVLKAHGDFILYMDRDSAGEVLTLS